MDEYLETWRAIREVIGQKMRDDLRPVFVEPHPWKDTFIIYVNPTMAPVDPEQLMGRGKRRLGIIDESVTFGD